MTLVCPDIRHFAFAFGVLPVLGPVRPASHRTRKLLYEHSHWQVFHFFFFCMQHLRATPRPVCKRGLTSDFLPVLSCVVCDAQLFRNWTHHWILTPRSSRCSAPTGWWTEKWWLLYCSATSSSPVCPAAWQGCNTEQPPQLVNTSFWVLKCALRGSNVRAPTPQRIRSPGRNRDFVILFRCKKPFF